MSKIKIIRDSADEIAVTMQRKQTPATGAYGTVNSIPSIVDDPSVHVLEYRSF